MVTVLFACAAAALVALDQWVKVWASAHLTLGGETLPLLGRLLGLRLTHNYGAAWSSFSGQRLLLIVLPAVIVLAALCLLLRRRVRHPLGLGALFLVMAGGVGNLIDRVCMGYVVDMLYFPFWTSYPTFNVADVCIVAGAILGSIYYLWFYDKCDAPKKEDDHGDHPAHGGN